VNEPITVTTAVKFKRWQAPNFAIQDTPPRPRQEGFYEAPKEHVNKLPFQVIDALAEAWLNDLYAKTEYGNPFKRNR
jgi:hypothetical protein